MTSCQTLMHRGKHHRHEEQGGHGGEDQATNHGASQRCILLGAFAQAQRHGDHADDHGQGRHQHGADARGAGFQRGGQCKGGCGGKGGMEEVFQCFGETVFR